MSAGGVGGVGLASTAPYTFMPEFQKFVFIYIYTHIYTYVHGYMHI